MALWDLFSSPKIIEKGVDSVISAGDKLFFTDEEKADMKLKVREHHLRLLQASEPFKVAQRLLALWFSFLFGISFVVGVGFAVFNMVTTYTQTKAGVKPDDIVLIDITPLIQVVSSFSLGIIMITIVAFYFGGGTLNSLKGK